MNTVMYSKYYRLIYSYIVILQFTTNKTKRERHDDIKLHNKI